jgi:hypothetical protein
MMVVWDASSFWAKARIFKAAAANRTRRNVKKGLLVVGLRIRCCLMVGLL